MTTKPINHKQNGYLAESIACEYLQQRGYHIIERNYTIRGGELDIIADYNNALIFIEVKLVNHVVDIHGYITPNKLKHLYKTIEYYIREHRNNSQSQLDVIFVRHSGVIEHIQNVTAR